MIDYLKKLGYKYFVRLDDTNELWATKTSKTSAGCFRKNAKFDCFELTQDESAYMSIFELKTVYVLD